MQDKLRVVFMGTPDFALPSLKVLDDEFDVVAVFCQPDKINGRGNKVNFCPIKQYAIEHNITVCQPETFKNNSCVELLHELDPQLIVVAAYGKILPNYVLDYPKFGCINVHGSLLPKYRGASPIQSCVLNGDRETGVTIMRISEGLDSGDIILQERMDIAEYETAGELFERMSEYGAQVLVKAITLIVSGKAEYIPQNESESTHVSIISKSMGKLDFSKSAFEIKCKVYGLNPWPSAYVEAESGDIKIHRVVLGGKTDKTAGSIVSVSKNGIEIACGDGNTVIITEIQRQGKKRMDAFSFSLGMHIEPGVLINSL